MSEIVFSEIESFIAKEKKPRPEKKPQIKLDWDSAITEYEALICPSCRATLEIEVSWIRESGGSKRRPIVKYQWHECDDTLTLTLNL